MCLYLFKLAHQALDLHRHPQYVHENSRFLGPRVLGSGGNKMPPELGPDADPLVIQQCPTHTLRLGGEILAVTVFWFHSLKILGGRSLHSVSTLQIGGQSSFCSCLGATCSGPAVLQPSNASEPPRGPVGTGAGMHPEKWRFQHSPGEPAAAASRTTPRAGACWALTADASPNTPKVSNVTIALELSQD